MELGILRDLYALALQKGNVGITVKDLVEVGLSDIRTIRQLHTMCRARVGLRLGGHSGLRFDCPAHRVNSGARSQAQEGTADHKGMLHAPVVGSFAYR